MSTPDPALAGEPDPADANPFDLLAAQHDDDARWAFGTGFTDPLAGVDATVPAGTGAAALARVCLALGDDALIYSHRLQQWVTRLPELEEETAVANVALDLLGQARLLLARAGQVTGATEDELAFFREERQFRNVRLAEHADADFAQLVVRLLIFATWRLALAQQLSAAADPVLAAVARRAVAELTYHRDYAAAWVVRLGDGTDLSHARAQAALEVLWPLAGDLFRPDPDLRAIAGPGASQPGAGQPGAVDPGPEFDAVMDTVLAAAGLRRPDTAPLATVGGKAGRDGVHTEAMGYILAELQSLARAFPDATW